MDPVSLEPRPLPGQSPHLSKQPWLIGQRTWLITLRSSWLIEHTTRSTFRYLLGPQTSTYLSDRVPSMFGAYQFPFVASLRIHAEGLIGHQLLQPRFVFLKILQRLHHLGLHPTNLLLPEVVRLLGGIKFLTDFRNLFPLPSSASALRSFEIIWSTE